MIGVSRDLKALGVRIAYTVFDSVKTCESGEALLSEARRCFEATRRLYKSPEALKDNQLVKAYRSFLWKLKIDPTKVRPSSEALLRRVLRHGYVNSINNVVDSGNIASIETLIPIGLYDLNSINPPLEVRLSRGGETFEPIGGRESVLKPGIPIMVDSSGTVVHIYPHRDSRRSMITCNTSRVLAVAGGVEGVAKELIIRALDRLDQLLARHAGARRVIDIKVV